MENTDYGDIIVLVLATSNASYGVAPGNLFSTYFIDPYLLTVQNNWAM